ncbi:MAG: PA2779 family protein [Betaproteobacteria bacterium]|jgi:hypothetical protein
MTRIRRQAIATALLVSMAHLALAPAARAALVDTAGTLPGPPAACERLAGALDRPDVIEHLTHLGIAPSELRARLSALTRTDAPDCADLDALPAGQGIFGVAVFVFAVLVITDTLGLTAIFPFTRRLH